MRIPVVAVGAIVPSGPRPEFVQPAGAIEALYEHSGVHAAKLSGSFFFSAEIASS